MYMFSAAGTRAHTITPTRPSAYATARSDPAVVCDGEDCDSNCGDAADDGNDADADKDDAGGAEPDANEDDDETAEVEEWYVGVHASDVTAEEQSVVEE